MMTEGDTNARKGRAVKGVPKVKNCCSEPVRRDNAGRHVGLARWKRMEGS